MTTWILLRGLTRERGHWGRFPEQWLEAFPRDRVVAMDLPGNGELHGLASPFSIGGMAAYCHREASRVGIGPPYNLLALSLGGMVATAWAQLHPTEVSACVLINTSFGSFSPLHHRLRPRAWPALAKLLLTRSARKKEQLIFSVTSNLLEPPADLIDGWVAIREMRPVSPGNTFRQLVAAARFQAPSQAPVPVLVLSSARDRLVHPCCSRAIGHSWHCAIGSHPTAGHDLPLDDGAWVVAEIHRWLGGSESQGT